MSSQLDTLRAFIAAHPAAPAPRTARHVLVVASGKGGAGTSTVATLLAVAAARSGRETLLVDAGAAASSLAQLLGIEGLGDGAGVIDVGAFALASARSEDAASATERTIRFRRLTSAYASYDAVVIDAGATMDAVMLAAAAAGRILAVTTSDRIGITATYALLKVVGQRFGNVPLGVLANRCDEVTGLASWERIATGTDRFLGHAVGFAGSIPDDAELRDHLDAGRPFEATYRGAAAAAADTIVARTFAHDARRTLSLIRN